MESDVMRVARASGGHDLLYLSRDDNLALYLFIL